MGSDSRITVHTISRIYCYTRGSRIRYTTIVCHLTSVFFVIFMREDFGRVCSVKRKIADSWYIFLFDLLLRVLI